MEMHGAAAEAHSAVVSLPSEGVFEPVAVVALRKVFTGMRTAAFGPVEGGMQGHGSLIDQVVELERLDEVSIPDKRAVSDDQITKRVGDRSHFAQPFFEHVGGAKDRAVILHGALHRDADFPGL